MRKATVTIGAFLAGSLPHCSAGGLLSVFPFGPSPPLTITTGPTVQVRNGTILGVHSEGYNQDFFLGVPFAQPPVGDLRFRNPAGLNTTFSQTVQATEYAPYCVGYGPDSTGKAMAEDCLYLNVIRPSGYEDQSLPVAVWIHSSSFTMGGTSDPRYNLSYIVENSVEIQKPIIAVSIAYRLSAWGFLASETVVASGQTNLGIKDQRIALQWIQENIGAFGGDPSQVTIWGQSSGATSVGYHLLAFNGRDDHLFAGAIMESGNPINFISFQNTSYYDPLYTRLVAAAGCGLALDTLHCLRSLPFALLNAAIVATNIVYTNPYISAWNPIIDGDILARYGSEQLADGAFVRVPIIDGCNTDEGTVFSPFPIFSVNDIESDMSSTSELLNIPASLVPEAISVYPDEPDYWIPSNAEMNGTSVPLFLGNNEWRRSAAYFGDAVGIANRRATCQAWAAAGAPAYCYRFNTVVAKTAPYTGATHFEEVAFVFNNTQGLGYSTDPFQGEPESYFELALLMSRSWAAFIHDRDPNGFDSRYADAPAWPTYAAAPAQGQNIVWDATVSGLAFTEDDDFRQEGIQWIMDHALDYRR